MSSKIIFQPAPSTSLLSPPSFTMTFFILGVIFIIVFLAFFVFHYYHYRLWLYRTRTLDIEQRLHEHHAMQLFTQLQAEIISQRRTTTQTNMTEEASSAAMTVAYKDTIKRMDEAGSDECAICIEEFEEEEICGVVESCGHCFHKDCMDEWLKIESRCPLCRCLVHVVSHNNNNSQENET